MRLDVQVPARDRRPHRIGVLRRGAVHPDLEQRPRHVEHDPAVAAAQPGCGVYVRAKPLFLPSGVVHVQRDDVGHAFGERVTVGPVGVRRARTDAGDVHRVPHLVDQLVEVVEAAVAVRRHDCRLAGIPRRPRPARAIAEGRVRDGLLARARIDVEADVERAQVGAEPRVVSLGDRAELVARHAARQRPAGGTVLVVPVPRLDQRIGRRAPPRVERTHQPRLGARRREAEFTRALRDGKFALPGARVRGQQRAPRAARVVGAVHGRPDGVERPPEDLAYHRVGLAPEPSQHGQAIERVAAGDDRPHRNAVAGEDARRERINAAGPGHQRVGVVPARRGRGHGLGPSRRQRGEVLGRGRVEVHEHFALRGHECHGRNQRMDRDDRVERHLVARLERVETRAAHARVDAHRPRDVDLVAEPAGGLEPQLREAQIGAHPCRCGVAGLRAEARRERDASGSEESSHHLRFAGSAAAGRARCAASRVRGPWAAPRC